MEQTKTSARWAAGHEAELLHRLIDTIPVMIVVYDPALQEFHLNREAERLLGWSSEDARHIDLMAACYPDPAYRDEVQGYMQSLEPGWRDLWMTKKDGSRMESSWANVRLSDDTLVGIGIDISERRHAEATRLSERAFRTLAENSPDVIARFDRDLRHLYVNPVIEQITGLHPTQYLGRTNEEVGMSAVNVAEWNRNLRAVFESGQKRLIEFDFTIPDGEHHIYESRLVPEYGPDGQVATILNITRDITDRVTLEQTLQRTAWALGERNKELNCLYAVSSLAQQVEMPLAKLLAQVLDALVLAYTEPYATCARIFVDGREFRTEGFRESRWHQLARLQYGDDGGVIEVHYMGPVPEGDASPFLPDEQRLLDSVADIVSRAIRRQRDGAALTASEARYHNLFENMTDAYALHEVIIDDRGVPCDYRYIEVNPAFEHIVGLRRDAIVGRTVMELFPETETYWIATFGHVALTGESVHLERYSRVFGRYFDVSVTSPERGFFGVVFSDVTERRAMQEALRRREEEFRALVEHSPDLVSRYDREMRRIYANPTTCTYLGRSPTELVGKTNREVGVPDAVAAPFEEALRAVFASGVGRVMAVELPTATGLRSLESHLVPEVDAGGTVTTVLAIAHDVTERIESERELQRLNRQLAVNEAALRRSNGDLAEFASVVSHDLRAPLRAVSTLTMMIEEDEGERLSGEARSNLELLRQRVRGMDEMIRGLLDYARCDGGRFASESVSVRDLVLELAEAIERPAGFVIEAAPDLPTLTTDRVHLRQVFANLIGNAVKYHDRTDGHVRVAASDAGDWYAFSVADDGPGIAPEYHDSIFRMLQTVPGQKANGTGIGLAIVRKVVSRAGGEVTLESSPGQGATFRFTWPKSPPPDVD